MVATTFPLETVTRATGRITGRFKAVGAGQEAAGEPDEGERAWMSRFGGALENLTGPRSRSGSEIVIRREDNGSGGKVSLHEAIVPRMPTVPEQISAQRARLEGLLASFRVEDSASLVIDNVRYTLRSSEDDSFGGLIKQSPVRKREGQVELKLPMDEPNRARAIVFYMLYWYMANKANNTESLALSKPDLYRIVREAEQERHGQLSVTDPGYLERADEQILRELKACFKVS